jgi:hypothetical protein
VSPQLSVSVGATLVHVGTDLEVIQTNFRAIYLDGIPKLIVDGTAFLAFVCTIAATEALCGYRYGKDYAPPKIGKLFKEFVRTYYPTAYARHVDDLWELRNKLVHAFSTGRFRLTHHHSDRHLVESPGGASQIPTPAVLPSNVGQPFISTGAPIDFHKFVHDLSGPISSTGNMAQPSYVILNAEDFYSALRTAAEKYFHQLEESSERQSIMRDRLSDSQGGPIAVGIIP